MRINKIRKLLIILLVSFGVCSSFGLLLLNYSKIKQNFRIWLDIPCYEVEDLFFSWTAKYYQIDNTPVDENIEQNLQTLIDSVLIPARKEYGKYIRINSGYRCPELNKRVGGVVISQHQKGEAVDITAGSIEKNKILYDVIANRGIYDQLIWENGGKWIHVSYKREGKNRKKKFAL